MRTKDDATMERLKSPPFEPLQSANLKFVSLKMMLLLTLALAKYLWWMIRVMLITSSFACREHGFPTQITDPCQHFDYSRALPSEEHVPWPGQPQPQYYA